MRYVAQKVFRTGLQSLMEHDGRWYVSLLNRTNSATYRIPTEAAPRWKRALTRGPRGYEE